MRTYIVGGAVRDALLGLPVNDRDWVVVGATPHEMIAGGYLPVGKDFPVFLHPQTREEYALARTERKTAAGYHGFVFHAEPDVTLEEDLARRDLTINAMAQDDDGTIVDPFHGRRDLEQRVLRHVTKAFREDPVRILRVARFAARFTEFSLAPETMALMREMVAAGEVDALVAERVWQELARGLMEQRPSRMFEVLRECGALERLLPEVHRLWGVPRRTDGGPSQDAGAHLMLVLDTAAQLGAALPVRFACLTHDLAQGMDGADEERRAHLLRGVCERLRAPTECRELAEVVAREHLAIHDSAALDGAGVVRLLERCDAFRKPQRFDAALFACECEQRGRTGCEAAPYPQRPRLMAALQAAQSVDTHAIATGAQQRGVAGPQIGALIHAARVQAVQQLLDAKPAAGGSKRRRAAGA
jgi:tRNA nucleotidyltransferase (CCA-adding enzyme)